MSIKLDWEIEAEQPQIYEAGEDPLSRRQRRRARLWALLGVAGVLGLFAIAALAVTLRLRAVDEQIENALLDTVEAEVAALRIGDQISFMNAQRSASGDWYETQRQVFNGYQALKAERNIQLTGRVVDATIDETRARVIIEEVIDGVPYGRVWFYWRYDDGWRHVPPDYTFWGDIQMIEREGFSIRYRTMDTALAQAIAQNLSDWLDAGCRALLCSDLPEIAVEIIPDRALVVGWSPVNPWMLQVPSPLTGQARLDRPFDGGLRLQVARLIAERLVALADGGRQPEYPADAYYLRAAAISWLVGRFAQVNTNAFLMNSLAENFGDQAVGRLIQAMPANGAARIINTVTDTPTLDAANLDWRDFFTWRLTLEDELIARQAEAHFLALYDPAARSLAYQRYSSGVSGEQRTVISIMPEAAPAGDVVVRAVVQVENSNGVRQEAALFRLVDDAWLRLN
jgi:hypothetical protein